MKRFIPPLLCIVVVLIALDRIETFAQSTPHVPRTLSYQGCLIDVTGDPVPDGEYRVTMRLYDVADGGTALWEESLNVSTFQGHFNTYLGLRTNLDLPFDRPYWLAAQMSGEPEMTPRTLLVAAPYAFRSLHSETAAALAPGADGAVTGLNGAQGEVVLIGLDGIRVHRSGDTIAISVDGTMSATDNAGEDALHSAAITVSETYHTEGTTGVLPLALGGTDLRTQPPVGGRFQSVGTIVVHNPHATEQSVIHVNVVEKEDDGNTPNPENAIWMADVDDRGTGMFRISVGMIPMITNSSNYQPADTIRIGYTIVNPFR